MAPIESRSGQSGAALLLMMLVVVVGAAAILVTKLNRNSTNFAQSTATQEALADAKDALLSYALSYPDTHNNAATQLPCPDLDGSGSTLDGEAHTLNCGASEVSMLGRLPWKTLGMAPPRDGAGECLWYAVSGAYKSAGGATAAMINPDSNGQFELYQSETGALIEGQTPDERPVAVIIAPGAAIDTQSRQAVSLPGQQCSGDFMLPSFLESDSGSGVSNAVLTGGTGLEQFVRAAGTLDDLNDRIITISRLEMADLVFQRHDFDTSIAALTHMLARCVAAYGLSNPGGPNDLRLPWPAPVALTDYRVDAQYDDVAGGLLSGRLADTVGDSNALTSNPISQVVANCDPAVVPGWGPEMFTLWQNWKDHIFYYVAESFSPAASLPSACTNCITVNGGGQYAGVVIFA
ncbi:MAG: hypothetical protein ACR2Q3_17890, partial [Woeseiaceae bacterium]